MRRPILTMFILAVMLAIVLWSTGFVMPQTTAIVADGSVTSAGLQFNNCASCGLIHSQTSQAVTLVNNQVLGVTEQSAGMIGIHNIAPTVGIHELGGGLRIQQLGTPAAPTVTVNGTVGVTTDTYKVTAVDAAGNKTNSSSTTSVTNGNATQTTANFNTISGTLPAGTVAVDIVRTAGGANQGSMTLANQLIVTNPGGAAPTYTFNDTGISATVYTTPSRDATGDATIDGNIIVSGAGLASANPATVTHAATIDVSTTMLTTSQIVIVNPSGAETINYTTLPSKPTMFITMEWQPGANGTQTITCGTNLHCNGTLAIGASGKFSVLLFQWDGTQYMETSRQTAI